MNGSFLTLIIGFASLLIFVIAELLIIRFNGSPVAVPTIPRDTQTMGSGRPLNYVIMGDSTAISQGSSYEEGFAVASINRLAETFTVRATNTAISGATSVDVRSDQLATALELRPDIVLLAVGANDATHFLTGATTRDSMQFIIDELKRVNPAVKIIVTGSPAMDSLSRFPLGAKQLMGLRTRQVNAVFAPLIKTNGLIHAPIAAKTREAFLADPTLTAADKFHPNARGYALWIPVINRAIDEAVNDLPH